jgi:IS30 family transposase
MAQTKKLSRSEKHDLIKKQIKIAPHLSARAISKQLGFSHVTIQKYKQELIKTG